MNAKILVFKTISSVLTAIGMAAIVHAQTIVFSDDFEGHANGSEVTGNSTQIGNFPYLVSLGSNTSLQYSTNTSYSGSDHVNMYLVSGNRIRFGVNSDLDQIEVFDFSLGYLNFGSAGTLTINVSATGVGLDVIKNGAYQFTYTAESGGSVSIKYLDANGSASSLGSVSGSTLRSIRISVNGNTQQLFIGGTAYGGTVATAPQFNNGIADYVYMLAEADQGVNAGIRIDDISLTQIPESTTSAAFVGMGMLFCMIIQRLRRK